MLASAYPADRIAVKPDVAVHWEGGVRYSITLKWTTLEAELVVMCWDRIVPLLVWKIPRKVVLSVWCGFHWEYLMSFLKRASADDQARRQVASRAAAEWAKKYPALHEYLTMVAYPDGGKRTTSTLMLFCDDGVWKACLKDRDQARSLWITSDGPTGLLDDLEACLQGDVQEWRKDKEWNTGGGQRKKG